MKYKSSILFFSTLAILTATLSTQAANNQNKSVNYNYRGTFDKGTVNLVIKQKIRGTYVTKFMIKTVKCTLTLHPNAKVNTAISINFATFGWNAKHGATINGIIAAPGTYLKTYIQWKELKTKSKCAIPKKASIQLVAE